MKKIYFLCTGNSCRSQMAEGYAKKYLSTEQYIIKSAGLQKHGLNQNAVRVMLEDNVNISNQQSKLIDPVYFKSCDLIVTLCGDANDKCPVISTGTKHIHWDLIDPAQAEGDEESVLKVFREVRDEIKQNILNLKI